MLIHIHCTFDGLKKSLKIYKNLGKMALLMIFLEKGDLFLFICQFHSCFSLMCELKNLVLLYHFQRHFICAYQTQNSIIFKFSRVIYFLKDDFLNLPVFLYFSKNGIQILVIKLFFVNKKQVTICAYQTIL